MIPKIVADKCNACESCVEVCPTEAIEIKDEIAVIDESICDECGVEEAFVELARFQGVTRLPDEIEDREKRIKPAESDGE